MSCASCFTKKPAICWPIATAPVASSSRSISARFSGATCCASAPPAPRKRQSNRAVRMSIPPLRSRNPALHQYLIRADAPILGRNERKAKPLEQPPRTAVRALEHRGDRVDAIVTDELGDHRRDRAPREAPAPISARELVSNPGAALLRHRRLHIAGKLAARQADHPVQPLLAPVRRVPRFEPSEALAQPLERRGRLPLILVDRGI